MFTSKFLDLHDIREQRNKKERRPRKYAIGRDYLPPLNSWQVHVAPKRTHERHLALLRKYGSSSASAGSASMQPPNNFTWQSRSDVVQKRGLQFAGLTPVFNQHKCGSCWAVATATAFSDRFRIWTQGALQEPLSVTRLLSCDLTSLDPGGVALQQGGCDGGFPGAAGMFLETDGLPTSRCWGYEWCTSNQDCMSGLNQASSDLNASVPACRQGCITGCGPGSCSDVCAPSDSTCLAQKCRGGKCSSASSVSATLFKGTKTEHLVEPEHIKADVFLHGPVVAGYTVFEDMALRASSAVNSVGWQNTAGIYMTVSGKDLYPPYSSTKKLGGHAVVIVGYGVQTNLDFLSGVLPDSSVSALKQGGGLFYWIVRNSWGSSWNGNGFWKCSFSYPNLGINVNVGIDRATPAQIGAATLDVGGGVSTQPVIPQGVTDYLSNSTVPTGGGGDTPSGPVSTTSGGGTTGIVVVIVVVVVVVVIAAVVASLNSR